jgi:hypothetical protein
VGRSKLKKQVVIYLPHEVHDQLRLQAARLGTTISELVETAVVARIGERRRIPLPAELESPAPELVVDALAEFGAPLWSSGQSTRLSLEEAILLGLGASRRQPSLFHVLPIVLHKNRARLSWPELRARADAATRPALGMLLDLTAEASGSERLRAWAAELWEAGARQEPVTPFFTTRPLGARYLALAQQRTPAVVRRWGFLTATPIEDVKAALERHCQPDLPSSTAQS